MNPRNGLSWDVVCLQCGHGWEEHTPPFRCPACRSMTVVTVPSFVPPAWGAPA